MGDCEGGRAGGGSKAGAVGEGVCVIGVRERRDGEVGSWGEEVADRGGWKDATEYLPGLGRGRA